jgi:zinc/manganese transport system permease protein
LLLLGVSVAAVSQITGTLLVFTLLVMPPATAQALTARPALSLVLSVGIALVATWAALTVAYYSAYPIGFWVSTFAFAAYVSASLARAARRSPRRR